MSVCKHCRCMIHLSHLFVILFLLMASCETGHAYKQLSDGNGHFLQWSRSDLPITYVIDTDVFSFDETAALERAFDQWGSVEGSSLRFTRVPYRGQTLDDCTPHHAVHLVTKKKRAEIPPPYREKLQGSAVTAAYQIADVTSGKIMSACIVIDAGESWSAAGILPSSSFDLESVALHEIGHFIGLDHPHENPQSVSTEVSVMGVIKPGEKERSLYPDDRKAARELYPQRGPW